MKKANSIKNRNPAIPIVSSLYDGKPYTAFVISNPVTDANDDIDGKVIARCYHSHSSWNAAYSCANLLWKNRCPSLYYQSISLGTKAARNAT